MTAPAVAVKVAVVAEEATVTDAGTVTTEVALLERTTVDPPEGAGLERVTVQVVVEEAERVALVHSREVNAAGVAVAVRMAVLLTLLRVAVRVEI